MAEHSEIALRAGSPEDFPHLLRVLEECPEAASWADTSPTIVAEFENEIVAFVLYRIVAGEGEVLNLAVRPHIRRLHVATALLHELFARAPIWHLEVRESNVPAISLYEALGFARAGRRERYYSNGEAALLFNRIQ